MGKEGDLSDFEQGMVVGGELGFPHTTISRFTENGLKKKKYQVSNCSLGKKQYVVDIRGQRRMVSLELMGKDSNNYSL